MHGLEKEDKTFPHTGTRGYLIKLNAERFGADKGRGITLHVFKLWYSLAQDVLTTSLASFKKGLDQ